jgi:hypothetical protein
MGTRIKGDLATLIGRKVAATLCHPGMRCFVKRRGKQEDKIPAEPEH